MRIRIVLIYSNFLVLGRSELRVVGRHVRRQIRIDFFDLLKHTAGELAMGLEYAAASSVVLRRDSR